MITAHSLDVFNHASSYMLAEKLRHIPASSLSALPSITALFFTS